MALLTRTNTSTGVILRLKILDTTKADGSGKTGLTFETSGLCIAALADNDAATTLFTVAAAHIEDITTLGTFQAPTSAAYCRFKEVDATSHKGIYEIHIDNTLWNNAKSLIVSVYGAAGIAQTEACIDLAAVADVTSASVTSIQTGLALEATLTEIKGTGWDGTQTLVDIDAEVDIIEAALSNIAVGSAAISKLPDPTVIVTTGTPTGTLANVAFNNAVYYVVAQAGTAIDFEIDFDIGVDGLPVSLAFDGRLQRTSGTSTIAVQVWNYAATEPAWETRYTINRNTVDASITIPLFAGDVGLTGSADDGKVRTRFYGTFTAGQAYSMMLDLFFINYTNYRQSIGYADGAIWIDTVNGTAGTVPYVNGTADHKVLTLADALSLATAMGLTRFRVANGSTLTLTGATNNKSFIGSNWTLALGGQSISGSFFQGCTVSGTATGAAMPHFQDCVFGNGSANVVLPAHYAYMCAIYTTGSYSTTIGTGVTVWAYCLSAVAGNATPRVIFADNADFNVRLYAGGLQFEAMDSSNLASFDCPAGQLKLVDCTGGTIRRAGMQRLTRVSNSDGVTVTEGYGMTIFSDSAQDVRVGGYANNQSPDEAVGAYVDTIAASAAAAVWATSSKIVSSVSGSVGSVASFGTLVADVAAACATAVWGTVTKAVTSVTNAVSTTKDGVIDTINTNTARIPASPAATGDIPSAATIAAAVWATGTKAVTSVTNAVSTVKDGVIDTINSNVAALPSASAIASAVWGTVSKVVTSVTDAIKLPVGTGTGEIKLTNGLVDAGVTEVDLTGIALEASVQSVKTQTDKMHFIGDKIDADAGVAEVDLTGIALEASVQSVKTQTDKMHFTGDKIDAEVPAVDLSAVALEATSQAIKTQTDQLTFTDTRVNANAAPNTTGTDKVYTVTRNGVAVEGAVVEVYPDANRTAATIVRSGMTDALGHVPFNLPDGTWYIKILVAGLPIQYDMEIIP